MRGHKLTQVNAHFASLQLSNYNNKYYMCAKNNWVRKIARVTRADRRRMVELRGETGVQRSFTERLVRSIFQWTGHVQRMADDSLPKIAGSYVRRACGDEGG